MILLSLNIRGVGGTLKLASVHRLLDRTYLDIIFLQETLVHEHKARSFMNTLRPTQLSCAVNSVGKSGGLLVTWDPNKLDIVPYLSCGGIFMTCICIESKMELSLLNVYGPCSDRRGFWNKVAERGMISHKNMIIAGDFNFTVNAGEVWGDSAKLIP
jgi:exonuclease III